MNNGLFDPAIVSFVFTPLIVTVALLGLLWWQRMHGFRAWRAGLDAPGCLLASAVRAMPEARRDWGAAMRAELETVRGWLARWRFTLGCVRVALFPPASETLLQTAGRSPMFGMLAITLPPLGLPMIYFAAVIVETIGGSPLTQTSRWSNPDAVMALVKLIVLLTIGFLLAGLPLGLTGWLRRERLRWLSGFGMILSACIFSYFLTVMHFLAGGD